jgi:pimeloyl-ACP methyl ester carboxylesterase
VLKALFAHRDSCLPDDIEFDGGTVPRIPFVVKSPNGCDMPASLFQVPNQLPGNPVVVFAHGNAMNQSQGWGWGCGAWPDLFPLGISCCFFDFAGCGNGTDRFVTMGIREKDELGAVLDHLRARFGCERLALWGLSMGGIAAMALVPERRDIAAAVIDEPPLSAAAHLRAIIAAKFGDAPLYDDARERIREMAGVDVEAIDLAALAPAVTVPIAFVQGYSRAPPVRPRRIDDEAAADVPRRAQRPQAVFDGAFGLIADAFGIPTK